MNSFIHIDIANSRHRMWLLRRCSTLHPLKQPWPLWTFLCLLAFLVRSDSAPASKALRSSLDLPAVMLWAWERPEDLRTLDGSRFGVAHLDQTIYIAERTAARPNLNRILLNKGTKVVAVVRVEMRPNARVTDPTLPGKVAALIVRSAQRANVAGLQVDFDATLSQRAFYRALLGEVRKQMPADMPLSMTALASWCGADRWMSELPIDEAVPMFFRMEAPTNIRSPGWHVLINDPRCRDSLGVSTDEPWPAMHKGARVYVFHPRAWSSVALKNLEAKVDP